MFNKKKMRQKDEKISALKRRIYELEELICPLNQHEFVEIDHDIIPDFDCGQIDAHCERTLQCRKCRKIVRDSDKITGFKYKTEVNMSKTITYDSQGNDITCMKEFDSLKYPCNECDRTDCEERKEYEDRVNQTEI